MQRCEQAPGLNMLQHGQAVHEHYKRLMNELEEGKHEHLQALYLKCKDKLPRIEDLERYQLLHDCGKFLCLTVIDGKRQFPNHAQVSAEQYSIIFPQDKFTKELILHDMDFHILRGDDLLRICRLPFAPVLYFTSWAEVSANAEMFGGIESESYKIKKSRLISAGKKLLKEI